MEKELDKNKLEEIQNLIKKDVKNITYEGMMTIIEFEDGQILPLYGGVAGIEGLAATVRSCSFCGKEASNERPVVSLNENDEPLICPDCVAHAVKTLIQNGIEVNIDLTDMVSQDIIEKMLGKR